jgi:hypothetical protein
MWELTFLTMKWIRIGIFLYLRKSDIQQLKSIEIIIIITYNDFKLCNPMNIRLWTSVNLFSLKSKSWIFEAPSNACDSMPVIWLRRKSNLIRFGNLPKSPSDRIRPSWLSLRRLNICKKKKKDKNILLRIWTLFF